MTRPIVRRRVRIYVPTVAAQLGFGAARVRSPLTGSSEPSRLTPPIPPPSFSTRSGGSAAIRAVVFHIQTVQMSGDLATPINSSAGVFHDNADAAQHDRSALRQPERGHRRRDQRAHKRVLGRGRSPHRLLIATDVDVIAVDSNARTLGERLRFGSVATRIRPLGRVRRTGLGDGTGPPRRLTLWLSMQADITAGD